MPNQSSHPGAITDGELTIGPVRCAWRPYQHGIPAEPLVRPWLGAALGMPAGQLPLLRDGNGRPRLVAPLAGFDTSWSHSGDGLLMAVGEGVQLGVDLEFMRPRPRALVLAGRFFTPAEAYTLGVLPDALRETAFVRLWCAKEAVLKAHGRGLSFGLHRLEFERIDHVWQMTACDPELGTPAEWTLQAFAPTPGYVATLAYRQR